MSQQFKRIICIALISALMLGALPALAATQGRAGYVVSTKLPVYADPSPFSKILGYMSFGESLWVRSWEDGWAHVTNRANGRKGYCALNGLSASNPNTLNLDVYVKGGGATVYAKPSTSCATRVRISAGACLKAVSMSRDKKWVRLKNNGSYGYALTKELSTSPTTRTVWIVSDDALSVSADSSLWGKSVGTISHGQRYQLLAIQGGSAKIRNASGRVGWISKDLISYSDPNTLSIPAYAQVSGRILWGNSILKGTARSIKAGTSVKIVSITPDGGWCRVKYDGRYYYALSVLFAPEKAPEGGQFLTCTRNDYFIYGSKTVSSDVRATLNAGDRVQLIGVAGNGGALKVRTADGVVGYAPAGGWKAG